MPLRIGWLVYEKSASDANLAGWPVSIPSTLLQPDKIRLPASGGQCEGVSGSDRPSRPLAQPLLLQYVERWFVVISSGGRTSGAVKDGWGRACARNSFADAAEGGGSHFADCTRIDRIETGQPARFASEMNFSHTSRPILSGTNNATENTHSIQLREPLRPAHISNSLSTRP